MINFLRTLYFRIFKRYTVFETKYVSYSEGDKMIRETADKPEEQRWVLDEEEDSNDTYGWVYLCRKKRIR